MLRIYSSRLDICHLIFKFSILFFILCYSLQYFGPRWHHLLLWLFLGFEHLNFWAGQQQIHQVSFRSELSSLPWAGSKIASYFEPKANSNFIAAQTWIRPRLSSGALKTSRQVGCGRFECSSLVAEEFDWPTIAGASEAVPQNVCYTTTTRSTSLRTMFPRKHPCSLSNFWVHCLFPSRFSSTPSAIPHVKHLFLSILFQGMLFLGQEYQLRPCMKPSSL